MVWVEPYIKSDKAYLNLATTQTRPSRVVICRQFSITADETQLQPQKIPNNTQDQARPPQLRTAVVCYWWRWRDSNPRLETFDPWYYMLVASFDLEGGQHGAQSTPSFTLAFI